MDALPRRHSGPAVSGGSGGAPHSAGGGGGAPRTSALLASPSVRAPRSMTTQKEVAIGESWGGCEPPNGSRLSCGRLARRRKVRWTTVRARQGHNTPLPLERSPPASFKRMLGRNPEEDHQQHHDPSDDQQDPSNSRAWPPHDQDQA